MLTHKHIQKTAKWITLAAIFWYPQISNAIEYCWKKSGVDRTLCEERNKTEDYRNQMLEMERERLWMEKKQHEAWKKRQRQYEQEELDRRFNELYERHDKK